MKYLDVPSSGSIADRTHSHNRGGQYTRNRRAPVQPVGTGRRAIVRANFGAASTNWAALSDANRAAWDGFAADHPYVDSLGQSVILTGHQMYVALGANLLNVGESLPATPPASTALPDISATTVTPDISTGITIAGFSGAGTDFVVVSFSKQISPGRSYNKTFWQPGAAAVSGADGTPLVVATATYASEFGTPVAGKKLFTRVIGVNQYGFASAPQIIQAVWVA